MSLSKSTSHLEFDRVLQTPAYFMKGASAATLNEWDTETPETVRPRSALIKRPASHPQLVPDTSVRAVEESLFRRTLHDYLCQSNPGAFRKSLLPESPSEYYLQKHLVRDLLCDIHKNRAPHDIANPKRGHEPVKNFKKKPVPVELQTKIEDFLQPGDPTRRRQTGYSPGHIRSVLHLDTFGPNQAKAVDTQRKQGLLPISPNSADKNISEDGSSHAGSRRGSQNWSRTSSRPASPSGLGLESINESKADSLPSVQFAADHVHHTENRRQSGLLSLGVPAAEVDREALAMLDKEMFHSTPKAKAIQYDHKLKEKLKHKTDRKVYEKRLEKERKDRQQDRDYFQLSVRKFEKDVIPQLDTTRNVIY